jgi:hypothetical protein
MKVKELIKLLLEASETEDVRIIGYDKDGAFEIEEIKDVEYHKPFETHGIFIVKQTLTK